MRADLIIDDKLREQFETDGYAVTPLLTPDDVAELLDVYYSVPSGVPSGFYTTLWSPDLDYRKKVNDAIVRIVGGRLDGVLRSRQIFLSQFAVKKGNEPATSECPMHQDWSFVDDRKHWVVSIWCPLVDVDLQNGCLAVVPGSHRTSTSIRANQPIERYHWPFDDLLPIFRDRYLTEVPMKAGDCILYDGGIVHGSRPNTTSIDRPVVVATVAPAEAQLFHYWQATPDQVEVFKVEPDFFWNEVQWGSRPNRPVAAVVESAPLKVQITEEDYLQRWKNRSVVSS